MATQKCNSDNINWEAILYDVLDNIFSYLNVQDLCRAAQVCRSWRYRAEQRMIKGIPQIFTIPNIYPENFNTVKSPLSIANYLNMKPKVSLLFVNIDFLKNLEASLFNKISNYYKQQFSSDVFTIGVDDCVFDRAPELAEQKRKIQGIAFPATPRLTIEISKTTIHGLFDYEIGYRKGLIQNIVKDLKLNKDNKHSTIIIFGCEFAKQLMSLLIPYIEKRLMPGTFTLWGGIFKGGVHAPNENVNNAALALVALKLFGKNLNSWSIVIENISNMQLIQEKLDNLKRNLRLKGRSIGLACCPYTETNTVQSFTKILKTTFPNIQFMSTFNCLDENLGVNSTDSDSRIIFKDSISVMILTYDS